MTGVWVPPRIGRELEQQTRQHNAEITNMVHRFEGVMRHWTDRLQRELDDPRLEVVFWPPYAAAEYGLTPGRYHVLRHNPPPAPATVEAVEVGGEFAEPGDWLIEKLRRSDLQNPQVVREGELAKHRAEQAKQRERERDDEERRDHLKDSYNARFRTSVSLNTDAPWTQNASGRKPKAG